MVTHADIDRRLLRLVTACVAKLDRDPALLLRVTRSAARIPNPQLRAEWAELLGRPWSEVRGRLLEDTESGAQLRQSAPLGGLLTNAERHRIFTQR